MTLNDATNNQHHFTQISEPYRKELRVHCYRMLGSIQDAEDLVQETYLRAWKKFIQQQDIQSYRPWLYKIATNACLDLLRQRKRRHIIPPDEPMATTLPAHVVIDEDIWIEPFPDQLIPHIEKSPEEKYTIHESVNLAFVALLQKLTPQDRAVLILRDVLGWKAKEVSDYLEISVSGVNSALLRARKSIKDVHYRNPASKDLIENYLDAYLLAWETKDIHKFTGLLKEDVIMSMPPLPVWFQGIQNLQPFFEHLLFENENRKDFRWKLKPLPTNGQPGFVIYEKVPDRADYTFFGVQVLTIGEEGIEQIDHFMAGDVPFADKPIKAGWHAFFDIPQRLS